MIWNIFALSFRQWINRPWEVVLTFFLPIVFFSIFALIFGRGIRSQPSQSVPVSLIDEVKDLRSQEWVQLLKSDPQLRFDKLNEGGMSGEQAKSRIQRGDLTACIVIRPISHSLNSDREKLFPWSITILADQSDQLAVGYVESTVRASLTRLAMSKLSPEGMGVSATELGVNQVDRRQAVPGVHQAEGDEVLLAPAAKLTPNAPAQRMDGISQELLSDLPQVERELDLLRNGSAGKPVAEEQPLGIPVQVQNVLDAGKANPVVSMYAAGIAVMFLLFNASAGSGVLIDERANQTLDRLLGSHLSMDQLLLGKWFYMTFLGMLQVTVMFIWASRVFGVNLVEHLDGFFMMTIATSLAASGFGLFLATLCQSRAQLNGISTVVVLTMSALGGSMVPRYLMNESLQHAGLLTFNAWAIDGYDKIFWRELPVNTLGPQLAVLTLSGVLFLSIARLLAIRWESK